MSIPPDAIALIKYSAQKSWPEDYEMQLYTVKNQTEAFINYELLKSNLDMSNEVNQNCSLKAETDWPEDYEMQIYTFKNQIESAIAFFAYADHDLPDHVLQEIRLSAFQEWQQDYEMMLYTLSNQAAAWKEMNAT